MKKSLFCIAGTFICMSFAFFSCTSAPVRISEHGPVALVSVVGNSSIPWLEDSQSDDDDDGNGILSNAVNKMLDSKNPELFTGGDRVDYAEASFREIVSEIGDVEFLDKDEVLQSEAYENLSSSYYNLLTSTVNATDYKDLTTIGSKKARMFMSEIGAKSLVLLQFEFRKKLANGSRSSGNVCGIVNMKVRIIDERGKEILNKTVTAQTSEFVKMSNRKYKKDEFVALFPDAIDNAIREFAVTYTLGE